MIKKLCYQSRYFLLNLIKLYQKTISFDHGYLRVFSPLGYCRFVASCSEYSYQAVKKYGIIKGGALSFWRILRCNPFNKGGHDPLI